MPRPESRLPLHSPSRSAAPVPVRRLAVLPLLALVASCASGSGAAPASNAVGAAAAAGPAAPERIYSVYVGAESADLMHRVVLGPDGLEVERTIPVGEMAVENEGPHGFATSPDGRYIYMTTGHGVPDGKLWKFEAGADTLVGEPILLGWFPATMDLTSDGLYALIANFNLHGEMVPSTVSVVYTPDMVEVDQIETCVMPHGLRMEPSGIFAYSNCMMNDLMVEIDTRTFEVSRRFSVAVGEEGPVEAPMAMDHGGMDHAGMQGMDHGASGMGGGMGGMAMDPSCSPTWAEPSADGSKVYVACNKGDRILEIDRGSWALLRVFETGRGPYNLDVTADGRMLVATLKQGAGVEFFDLESGTSVGRLPSTTTVTHGVVVSPDSRYAFVSVEGVGAEPGKVDAYDLTTMEQVGSVEVGQQAGGITFWKMEPPLN